MTRPDAAFPDANPPGRTSLSRQVSPHPVALARMREALSAEGQPMPIRALALHDTTDPAVALLDGWALVADVVSFYSERIADEGYLRTATERGSLRELARALGHELRPGVAARADLAFVVEDAPGAPGRALVPRGTPVQTVPGANQMPQVFETSAELEARAAWNAIPGAAEVPQWPQLADTPPPGETPPPAGAPAPTPTAWSAGPRWVADTGLGLRPGDLVLVGDGGGEPRAVAAATAVDEPADRPGWTRVTFERVYGEDTPSSTTAVLRLDASTARTYLYGWNAPDPHLIPGADIDDDDRDWNHFGVLETSVLELDGDHPQVQPGTWFVLEDRDGATPQVVPLRAVRVVPSAASRYALAGRITQVIMEESVTAASLDMFHRRSTVVHVLGRSLHAATRPRTAAVTGGRIELAASDALTANALPPGRAVVVTGWPYGRTPKPTPPGLPVPEPPQVETTRVDRTEHGTTVFLDPPLEHEYDPRSVRVLGNVVEATHGESVAQVLGSGDGRAGSVRFPLRRGPLTHTRDTTASGVRSSLEVRVDGVVWSQVESLADADGDDRVVAVREEEDGTATVVFGDGRHGARVPTGQENVTATYRVGIGPDGAAEPGQVSMLLRRPFGIRSVSNPAAVAASDYASRETADQARLTAPVRVRTLDRAVSLADHGDVAQGFAGVGTAIVAAVWNGRHDVVTVTVTGVDVVEVSDRLRDDLQHHLDELRDPGAPLAVCKARPREFGVELAVRPDPAYRPLDVTDAVRARLLAVFGGGRWGVARPVSAAQVLTVARAVPGVAAVRTLPTFVGTDRPDRVEAGPARWNGTKVVGGEAAVLRDAAAARVEVAP